MRVKMLYHMEGLEVTNHGNLGRVVVFEVLDNLKQWNMDASCPNHVM